MIMYHTLLKSVAVFFQVSYYCRQLYLLRLLIDSKVNHELDSSMTRVQARFRKRVSKR